MDFSWLTGNGENNKRVRYLIILGTLALIVLIASSISGRSSTRERDHLELSIPENITDIQSRSLAQNSLNKLEEQLTHTLKKIHGVGDVTVMITYTTSSESDYAYNTTVDNKVTEERDSGGGTRVISEQRESSQLVLMRSGQSASDQPVVIKTIEPEIGGVLVIAEGAESSLIRAQLVKAIQTVLNIPTYKINVLPKGR